VPPDQLREKIGRVIYFAGLAEEQLNQSFQWLERAYELSLRGGCTVWATHVKSLQKQTLVLANDLRSIISAQRSRSDGPTRWLKT